MFEEAGCAAVGEAVENPVLCTPLECAIDDMCAQLPPELELQFVAGLRSATERSLDLQIGDGCWVRRLPCGPHLQGEDPQGLAEALWHCNSAGGCCACREGGLETELSLIPV